LRVLFDAGEAEDLTQTIFLEIYKKMGEFDTSRGTFKVWVLQRTQSRSVNRFNYLLVRKFHRQVELAAVVSRVVMVFHRQSVDAPGRPGSGEVCCRPEHGRGEPNPTIFCAENCTVRDDGTDCGPTRNPSSFFLSGLFPVGNQSNAERESGQHPPPLLPRYVRPPTDLKVLQLPSR
jgi:hypothetical protein